MKLKTFKCLLVLLFFISTTNVALATEEIIHVYLNNELLTFDVNPVIDNGRTLVPLRTIFENLGAKIQWNAETKTITATKDDTIIQLTIGDENVLVNDNAISLDVATKIVDGRTLAPLRFVAETLNCKVDWDAETNTIYLTSNEDVDLQLSDKEKEIYDLIVKSFDAMNDQKGYFGDGKIVYNVESNGINLRTQIDLDIEVDIINSLAYFKASMDSLIGKNEFEFYCTEDTFYTKELDDTWTATDSSVAKSNLIENNPLDEFDFNMIFKFDEYLSNQISLINDESLNMWVLEIDLGIDDIPALSNSIPSDINLLGINNTNLSNTNFKIYIDKDSSLFNKLELNLTMSDDEMKMDIQAILNNAFSDNIDLQMPESLSSYLKSEPSEPNDNSVSETEMDYLRAGNIYSIKGYYESALAAYNQHLTIEPNNFEALFGKGRSLYELGEFEEASLAFNKCLQQQSENEEVYEYLANIAIEEYKYDEAIALCDTLLTINPKSSNAYILKGDTYYWQSKYNEAIKQYDKAIIYDLDNIDLFLYKATALYYAKRYNDCIKFIDNALTLHKDNIELLSYKAFCYWDNYNLEEAIEIFKEILELDPTNENSLQYIVMTYIQLQNYEQAEVYYDKLVEVNDENPYLEQIKATLDEAKLPLGVQLTNFVAENYLYINNVDDFTTLSDNLINDKDITVDDIEKYMNSIRVENDIFTYVIKGDLYNELSDAKSSSQVSYQSMDNNVEYIKINSFTNKTGVDFIKTVNLIENPEEKNLVIDLRNNMGGDTSSANEILAFLLPECTTSTLIDRYGYSYPNYSYEDHVKFNHIYIMTNEYSASSSELVTLSLKKYLNNVTVLGRRTFGKGVGQIVYEDKANEYMIFLVSFYWNVREANIQYYGIMPDVEVSGTSDTSYFSTLNKLIKDNQ